MISEPIRAGNAVRDGADVQMIERMKEEKAQARRSPRTRFFTVVRLSRMAKRSATAALSEQADRVGMGLTQPLLLLFTFRRRSCQLMNSIKCVVVFKI